MPKARQITQQRLKELLLYDPETGIFTWRERLTGYKGWDVRYTKGWNSRYAGKPAGTIKEGYVVICVEGSLCRAHHLAFLWMTGRMPPIVDHEDLDRSNNRWRNLREATYTQNFANTNNRRTNTSGIKGVTWNRATSSWRAKIQVNKRMLHLGLFPTREQAAAAYAAAAVTYFGAFARTTAIRPRPTG